MKENTVLIDKDKLESLAYEEVQKMRHIFFGFVFGGLSSNAKTH